MLTLAAALADFDATDWFRNAYVYKRPHWQILAPGPGPEANCRHSGVAAQRPRVA